MKYKGYEGVVEFDEEARLFHGEVVHLRDVITFQGESVTELERAFHESVDDYLAFCEARSEKPEKPYSGKLILRIAPELHRQVSYQARVKKKSVNQFISEALESYNAEKKE